MQTEQQRRQAFVEQVRRAIGPSLKDLSQRQKDLLDASVSKLFRQNRPVTDDEIKGRLELITEFVSPLGQENLRRVYWDFRRRATKQDEGQ